MPSAIQFGNGGGISVGAGLNYNIKKSDLIGLRYFNTTNIEVQGEAAAATPFVVLPYFTINLDHVNNVSGLVYGKRFVNDNKSWTIAAGPGIGFFYDYIYTEDNNYRTYEAYFTIPFEASFDLFMRKPDKFGIGMRVKIFGAASKYSSLGVGVALTLGYHK